MEHNNKIVENSTQIKSFTDLNVWKEGHRLVLLVYQKTENFPKHEQFGLVIQMRRAAVSITSNIAEGFSRRSSKEKIQFYSMAHGSLTELENQLIIAKDINYLRVDDFDATMGQVVIVHRLLNKFISRTKEFL